MKTKWCIWKAKTGYDASRGLRTGCPSCPLDVAKKTGAKKAIGDQNASNQNPGTDSGIIPKNNLSDNAEI